MVDFPGGDASNDDEGHDHSIETSNEDEDEDDLGDDLDDLGEATSTLEAPAASIEVTTASEQDEPDVESLGAVSEEETEANDEAEDE
jgi:hypothetical protein